MQTTVSHGVGKLETPIFGMRLNNFKTAGHPFNGIEQGFKIQIRRWCAAHTKNQFRLQSRLTHATDVNRPLPIFISIGQGGVPDSAPDRFEHLIALPNTAVGKANFVTTRQFTALLAQSAHLQSHLVSSRNISRNALSEVLRPQLAGVNVLQ